VSLTLFVQLFITVQRSTLNAYIQVFCLQDVSSNNGESDFTFENIFLSYLEQGKVLEVGRDGKVPAVAFYFISQGSIYFYLS
jgi:hypothetical protein